MSRRVVSRRLARSLRAGVRFRVHFVQEVLAGAILVLLNLAAPFGDARGVPGRDAALLVGLFLLEPLALDDALNETALFGFVEPAQFPVFIAALLM